MISTPDRVKAIELIDEAVSSGAKRTQACKHLGICDCRATIRMRRERQSG